MTRILGLISEAFPVWPPYAAEKTLHVLTSLVFVLTQHLHALLLLPVICKSSLIRNLASAATAHRRHGVTDPGWRCMFNVLSECLLAERNTPLLM